jgi:zinc transport system substrate-binding protein
MHFNLRRIIFTLLLLSVGLPGCTTSDPSSSKVSNSPTNENLPDGKLDVVATFLPVYLFTKAVAGNAADVTILIPPGTEVHEYQSTPADVKAIAQADVLVENGLDMEEFLDDTVENAQNPDLKRIDASQDINPVEDLSPVIYPTEAKETEPQHNSAVGKDEHAEGEHAEGEHAEGEHAEGHSEPFHTHAQNPHIWLDPILVIQQVENIQDGLAAADPANRSIYAANAAAYIDQLKELDQKFQTRLQAFSDRTFITFHDAFPYLAQRYDLKQVAIVAIPEDNLAPADIQKTIETVKEFQVKALFSEPGTDNKLLESLSQDLNLTLRSLDSLESGELDPQYYFTAMGANLKTLESAFK